MFGGLTASGAHTFAILILLMYRLHPKQRTLAGLGFDELRLPNPVRPGDELSLEVTLLEKRESKSKPDCGILRRQVVLRNQNGETVLGVLPASWSRDGREGRVARSDYSSTSS